jgi:hypothetical protein
MSGTVYATYCGEDLEVCFSAMDHGIDDDSGVGGLEDVTIESVSICGFEVDLKTLPLELRGLLHDLSDDLDWDDGE